MILFQQTKNGDIMLTYLLILVLKIIENAIGTLRMILVTNGSKHAAAGLQLLCSSIWIISTSIVVINIQKDLLKIVFFILGCTAGSYVGSILEEKMAFGECMIMCISSLEIMDQIRECGYNLTSTKGTGIGIKNIIFIMTTRKKKMKLINTLRKLDPEIFIMSGSFLYEKTTLHKTQNNAI